MNLDARIESLVKLGRFLSVPGNIPEAVYLKAKLDNPWFTQESVDLALSGISKTYLSEEALRPWLSGYDIQEIKSQRVGLILAGNIPMVGIHDILCTYLTGHKALIKYSSKDKILLEFILNKLAEIDPRSSAYFISVERLENYEAIIATGSNDSRRYFEKYFEKVPHICRSHRNGIAIVDESTTGADLTLLGHDVFDHFGLGCRNVSKIYIKEGIKLDNLFEAWEGFEGLIDHNKYKNNYDYNYALYLMNQEEFYTNNAVILRPNKSLNSRIASVHYEYYSDIQELKSTVLSNKDIIQCVVASKEVEGLRTIDFGSAQSPQLDDYADGVDTINFLLELG